MKNGRYEIQMREVYKSSEYSDYAIVLGKSEDGTSYVTWDSSYEEGVEPSYFWGHYFSTRENAIIDYHKRLLNHYEFNKELEEL